MGNLLTLYHNTSNENAIKINTEGIKGGMRMQAYGKGSEAEGAGVWCTTQRGYGYGGATITFQIDNDDENLKEQNDTEYIVYRDIKPEEIIDIDLVVIDISSVGSHTQTLESDVPVAIQKYGKEKFLKVCKSRENKFIPPYNYDTLVNLVETGNKYCKGKVVLTEAKVKGIPAKYQKMVTDFYKGGDGYWVIELAEGIDDGCGNSYIWEKTKREALDMLEVVYDANRDILEESKEYPIQLYHFTNIDKIKNIMKQDKLLANENNLICCTEIDDFYNFKTNADRVRITINTDKLPSDCIVRKGNPVARHNVNSEKEWVIDFSNSDSKYLQPSNKSLMKIEFSPALQDDNPISNSLRKKLEEASRNELLAKSKAETITRYNKSAGYKGFSLVDIDTTAIKTRNTIIITNRVGDYFDTVELEDILYWVGLEVDEARDKKMSLETVRKALLNAMDGMDIKVDCNCGDFVYRFAYMATVLEYKYGKPENRESKITNPDGYGAMCKHLIALLSNKSWVKQVASTLQQWIIDEIDWVRNFLKVEEEDFQIPDEYARYLGKHGAMKKFWDKTPDAEVDEEEPQEDNDEANEVGESDIENNEATNDTPEEEEREETPTLDNKANMPKAFRNNQDDEELEEK